MKSNKVTVKSNGGIGLCGLLTVAFVVLKLCKVITWSWWWVLAPTWIPIGISLLILFLTFIFCSIAK